MTDGLRWSAAQLAAYEGKRIPHKGTVTDVGRGNAPDDIPLVGDSSVTMPPSLLRGAMFTLPLPPSVNALYGVNRMTGEKFLLDDQRRFRRDVITLVAASSVTPLTGRIELRVVLYQCNARRQDISNRVKALEDALQHAGAFHDDSQIDRLIVERQRGDTAECFVYLQELG